MPTEWTKTQLGCFDSMSAHLGGRRKTALKQLMIEVAYALGVNANAVEMTALRMIVPDAETGLQAFWISMTLQVADKYTGCLSIRPNRGYGSEHPQQLSARGTFYRDGREWPFSINYSDPPQFSYND